MSPNNGRYLLVGSDCVYEGGLTSLVGKTCTILKMSAPRQPLAYDWGIAPHNKHLVIARFDYDGRERVVDIRHLTPEGASTVKNFKTAIKTALDALLKPLDADSTKEQAVRRLGVASELATKGEAEKKKAKTDLKALGIIVDDQEAGTVFDSDRYVMVATVKAASSRLDAGALDAALDAERISAAAKRRILAAATITNKAAVSYKVESK